MNRKSGTSKASADRLVKTIRRKTRQTYSAEEKIRIVLAGLRGEESISALCRREGIPESLYYSWSKEFLEAGYSGLGGQMLSEWVAEYPGMRNSSSVSLSFCFQVECLRIIRHQPFERTPVHAARLLFRP